MFYALECTHLTKQFDGTAAVKDASLRIHNGGFLTLLGPSGCGKTTTLRLIAGFETPDSGKISVHQTDITDLPIEKRRVGMVFQEYALFPHINVGENIAFGLQGNKHQKADQIAHLLRLLGLDGLTDRMPHQLSGGQQQRVALARALAPQPRVLLLDEPFSNLDATLRAQVRRDVKNILKETGITCVFVTHDQEEALSLSDQIAVMFDGRVFQIGTPHEIYAQPINRDVADFVGEANFIPAEAHGDTATSIFGQTKLQRTAHGQVELVIRPEMLHIQGGTSDTGISASVQWIDYYGHDQRLGILLENGTPLVARINAHTFYEIDQVVRVSLPHAVHAFS
ncbi:MAG: ABC transporter ATP-binding protein [Aggregatilineales bacterium]